MSSCACGSGASYEECCLPILSGTPALTAEALMRSRYTAFVVGNLDHIERSHAPEVRDQFDRLNAERLVDEVQWLGLEIRRVVLGGPQDETGQVEFFARYSQRGKTFAQHELAGFRRENGVWVYASGEINPKTPPRVASKVGRNDPCSCGSGKKYKKCCGC
ncbi:MAG: YchJ family protein [Rhodospirillaceae bacterium]